VDTQANRVDIDSVDQLARELEVTRSQRDHEAARAAALSAELLRSEAALADLEELRARVTEVEAQLERALDEVDSAYRQIGNLTTELDAVHATVSWRLTGVLRAVRRRTRGSSAP